MSVDPSYERKGLAIKRGWFKAMKMVPVTNAIENDSKPLAPAVPIPNWLDRRAVVLSVAAFTFVGVFVVREIVSNNSSVAVGLLFVIPIALVGLELGLRAGLGLALGTIFVVALRRVSGDLSLDALGVVTRSVALLAVAVLAGGFSDRMRAFQVRQSQLLLAERERAALLGELHGMHRRLQDQFRNAEHILDLQERERRGIAEQLHEQAAQAMAAAMLIVGRLERDIVDELTQAQLRRTRHSVRECIAELRRLAGSLHSPVLEELGLGFALQRLVEREVEEGSRSIDLRGLDDLPQLPADVEISAYRAIEDALDATEGPIAVGIGVDPDGRSLEIAVETTLRSDDGAAAELLTTRARLEIVGGSLASLSVPEGVLFTATIPLERDPGWVSPPASWSVAS